MSEKNAEHEQEMASPLRAEAQPFTGAAQEVEIKFRLEKIAVDRVLKSTLLKEAKISPVRELVSVYFDTPEKDLLRHAIALRVRRKGRSTPVFGVKWGGDASEGVFTRGEVEVLCPGGMPSLDLFDQATQSRLTGATADRALEPVFETRVKRRIVSLRHRHSDIEMAIDEGQIVAGEARLPLLELELELKSGNQHDLLDCAFVLALECELQLDFESKSARGYRLATGQVPAWNKAASIELHEDVTFDDLLATTIFRILSHFVANWAALRESDTPESIHQLRVALRRMRSALGVFKKAIRLPELEDIRLEAKRIASALGPARECDVFRQNALQGPFRDRPEQFKGAVRLLDAVEIRRREAYIEARQLFESSAASLFVLKVQSFVARRAWRTALSPQDLGLLTSPGKVFAGHVLDRLLRRTLKRGKSLAELQDEERHDLRILLKNLRYATEFFGSLFADRKEVRHFLRLVADLQEDLGAHNDAATAQAFLQTLPLASDNDSHFASGYLLGWYRHAMVAADGELLQRWKEFKRADIFWD